MWLSLCANKVTLTTPTDAETVRWYITNHIFEASPAQIDAIQKVEGKNVRHVQASYGRVVEANKVLLFWLSFQKHM
jgi:carbonic anhydrase